MQLKPHCTLQDGKYEIIRPLGQGGFGITYLAEQTLMDRKVCIKEFFIKEFCERDEATSKVSLGTASNAEMMQRYMAKFIKEARTIAKLDHPNIVRIHDVFKENNTAYIVMEYIDGMSLGEYIKKHGPLTEEKAIPYIHRVCDALSFAHGQHIMHLDVKPSNIMLDQEHERLVLIDFGLAKQYTEGGEQTSSTPVGLSQGYAPLEQYKAGGLKEFSPATDVYSLGATLYKLLTGETPPSASDVNEDGLPPLPPSISATTRQAIEKAMQPKRKDRPQSVEAFLALLDGPATEEPLNDETLVSAATKPYLQHQESAPVVTPPPAVNKAETASPEADNSTPTKPWKKYGLIGGIAALLIVGLIVFLSRGKEPIPDSLLIDGQPECTAEFDKAAAERTFTIEKNFEDKWTYSGIPEWCTAKTAEGIITLNVSENKAKEERTATIVFRKKGDDNALGRLIIRQGTVIYGSLKVSSTPSGATIWLDGKNTQKTTPATLENLTPARHSIQLVQEGYNDYSGVVTINSGKRAEFIKTLEAKDGEIEYKQSNPSTASSMSTNNSTTGLENGHQWVDLGVSVKWATCNVGASSPGEYGSYFAWGELSPKMKYTLENHRYCSNVVRDTILFNEMEWEVHISYNRTKYNGDPEFGEVDNKTRLDLADDAARMNWGGKWRMPTKEEFDELEATCIWEWTIIDGSEGCLVTSVINNNTIFFPAAGGKDESFSFNEGSTGNYWSSTTDQNSIPKCLWISPDDFYTTTSRREQGLTIRPVIE